MTRSNVLAVLLVSTSSTTFRCSDSTVSGKIEDPEAPLASKMFVFFPCLGSAMAESESNMACSQNINDEREKRHQTAIYMFETRYQVRASDELLYQRHPAKWVGACRSYCMTCAAIFRENG